MSEVQIKFKENKPDHHYRTEIPNIIFEMVDLGFLDSYDFIVYCTIKRIAGDDGYSCYSMKKLAKKCGISERKLIECIKHLKEKSEFLETSLIEVEHRKKDDGSSDTSTITVVDVWSVNGDFFKQRREFKTVFNNNREGGGGAQYAPGVVHNMHQGGAQYAYKEEPVKKTHVQEEPTNPTLPSPKKDMELKWSVMVRSVSDEERKVFRDKLLKLRFKENGAPEESFTEKEVDRLMEVFDIPTINKYVCELAKIRSGSKIKTPRNSIKSEKGWLLHAIRNRYKI